MRERYDVVIIGGGPAGLTAGTYASRAGLTVIIVEKQTLGGQVINAEVIENYPGFPLGISGFELAERMRSQAATFGAEITTDEIAAIEDDPGTGYKTVLTGSGQRIAALAVVIATGASWRKLGIPGEDRLWGKGVSTCATCDAALYRDKHVVVVGGGDTAIHESLFLARFVNKITLVHRRDRLRATKILQDRISKLGQKVEFRWNSVVTEIAGTDHVTGVTVKSEQTGATELLGCDGVFVLVGFDPNSGFVRGYLAADEAGYIITDEGMATSVDGVFACGDVRRRPFRQIVTACGEGAVAAFAAQHYVEEKKGTAYR